jgi:hypothetical protein
MADTTRPKLLELAKRRFDTLSPAEQKLFDAAPDGKEADCTNLPETDRVIQEDRLVWLCTSPDASAQVTPRVLLRSGFQAQGPVNLNRATRSVL